MADLVTLLRKRSMTHGSLFEEAADALEEKDRRIEALEAKVKAGYNIVIRKVEMDFGGEGVIVHPNDIAGMETLITQKQSRIEELQSKVSELEELGFVKTQRIVELKAALKAGCEDMAEEVPARTCGLADKFFELQLKHERLEAGIKAIACKERFGEMSTDVYYELRSLLQSADSEGGNQTEGDDD